MMPEQFAALPPWIDVRLVSYTLTQKGFRTRQVTIATTLLDEQAWPDAKLAELYGQAGASKDASTNSRLT